MYDGLQEVKIQGARRLPQGDPVLQPPEDQLQQGGQRPLQHNFPVIQVDYRMSRKN